MFSIPLPRTRDSEIGLWRGILLAGGIALIDRAVLSGMTFLLTFLNATFATFLISQDLAKADS